MFYTFKFRDIKTDTVYSHNYPKIFINSSLFYSDQSLEDRKERQHLVQCCRNQGFHPVT